MLLNMKNGSRKHHGHGVMSVRGTAVKTAVKKGVRQVKRFDHEHPEVRQTTEQIVINVALRKLGAAAAVL